MKTIKASSLENHLTIAKDEYMSAHKREENERLRADYLRSANECNDLITAIHKGEQITVEKH
jgi:hypothetical protein